MIRNVLLIVLSMSVVLVVAVDVLSYLDWPGTWRYQHARSGIWIRHHATRVWAVGGLGRYPYSRLEVSKGVLYGRIRVPLWQIAAALAAYPIFVMARRDETRRRRRSRGQCVACGYDLTGNLSGVCPECGTEAKRLEGGGRDHNTVSGKVR